jgi:hypothetical protein
MENILVGFEGSQHHPQERDQKKQPNKIDGCVAGQGLKEIADLVGT